MPDWYANDERIRTAIECERMFMLRTCGKAIGDLLLQEREDTARAMRDEFVAPRPRMMRRVAGVY